MRALVEVLGQAAVMHCMRRSKWAAGVVVMLSSLLPASAAGTVELSPAEETPIQ